MKYICLLAFCFSLVFAQSCVTPQFTGVCSSVTAGNASVDSAIGQVIPTIETTFNQLFTQWKTTLQNLADKHNIDFCEDCWTAMSHMLCSALVPQCGFVDCLTQASTQIQGCTANCNTICSGNGQLSADCANCLSDCYGPILTGTCAQYIMGRSMCSNFVQICGCVSDANVVSDVCQYFPAQGYSVPFPSGLSCTGKGNWCSQTVDAESGLLCPNSGVCMVVPQASPNAASSMLASPVKENTGSGSDASGIIISSALIAFAALF